MKSTKNKLPIFRILEKLRERAEECEECRLSITRTRSVFSAGNPLAELVVLGEGPGEDEDREGVPFVGKSGRLIDRILETLGFDRTTVYICNVVKCRACGPKYDGDGKLMYGGRLMNRAPELEEIAACSGFLRSQLDALPNKRLIFCFGVPAARWALSDEDGEYSMGRMRGRVFRSDRLDGLPVICTYHPSYLLRNPQEKVKTYADVKMVKKFLAGEITELSEAHEAESYAQTYRRKPDIRPWGKMRPDQKDKYSEKLIGV